MTGKPRSCSCTAAGWTFFPPGWPAHPWPAPRRAEVFGLYRDFFTKKYANSEKGPPDFRIADEFVKGNYAMTFAGTWFARMLEGSEKHQLGCDDHSRQTARPVPASRSWGAGTWLSPAGPPTSLRHGNSLNSRYPASGRTGC